ncbi:MAG: molybdopterin molybdotransferase MoeA [Clostridia bacterium]|nr:molybdopterin molybdotransferase MoeA [Clostridia bacterium]
MLENASWTEARDLLLGLAKPVETEAVPLDACGGRVLAFDLKAGEDVPPFDRSAYDGYAFRAADTESASRENPVVLRITETVAAGQVPKLPVLPGEAAHVMTGAKIPDGADAVINFERTEFTEASVTLFEPYKSGSNIVKRGEDVQAGALLAPCGTVIDAGLAGTLAAQGIPLVNVYRKPVVGLISTGSEVVEAEEEQPLGKIRNANRSTFTALLTKEGCDARYLGLAGDDAESIRALIEKGLAECDAVILTGGVSVGDWDVTPAAMEQAGAEIMLRGVKMKPGMACAYGVAGGKLVLGLSGNPASSFTNFCACALPAIRKLCGRKEPLPKAFQGALAKGFRKKSPADRFLRGRLSLDDGTVKFLSSTDQGNVVLSSTIGCDAFLLIPGGSGPVEAGTKLNGFLL